MIAKIALLCAGLVWALPALATVEVPPDPKRPRIMLGGQVQIPVDQLKQVGAARPACVSPPFTAEEFLRALPRQAFTETVTINRQGGKVTTPAIRLEARNDRPARTVPITRYVEEINAVEKFYNANGVTLRHGPLALPPVRAGLVRRNACLSRDAMSGVRAGLPLIHYRLVDAPEGGGMGGAGNWQPPQTKPVPPGPGDVMGGVVHPGDLVTKPGDLAMKPGSLSAIGQRYLRKDLVPIPQNGIGRGAPVMHVMKGCAKPCTLELDNTAYLTPAGKLLRDAPDEVVDTVKGCKIITYEGDMSKCPDYALFDKKKITRREQWSQWVDVDFFLAHWKDACMVIAHEEGPGKGNSEMLYTTNSQSEGNIDMTKGQAAKTFYDGVLHFKNSEIADCALDIGSNSMFGVQFCLRYNSANDFSQAKGFDIHDDAAVQTDLTLFGVTFDLAGGIAQIDWKQPVTQSTSLALVSEKTSSTLKLGSETQHFEGPGGIFPVGPVPISVRSFADIDLNGEAHPAVFDPPGLWTGHNKAGKIGTGVGAKTEVSVGMEAAIDAIVLSAGVSGKLTLLSNSVEGDIASLIAPAQNEVRVEKRYSFSATTLKGTISAFVEVDLYVYTERYTVDLVSFPGKTATWAPPPTTWGPAKSVVPAGSSSGPVCN